MNTIGHAMATSATVSLMSHGREYIEFYLERGSKLILVLMLATLCKHSTHVCLQLAQINVLSLFLKNPWKKDPQCMHS